MSLVKINVCLFITIVAMDAVWARVSKIKPCPSGKITSSMYDTPHQKDLCPGGGICGLLKKIAANRGSVRLNNGNIYTYSGQQRSIGDCPTAIGSSGVCLTPFVSVAADMRHYNPGDIIEMPGLKGKKVLTYNGKKITHPGYLIVQDIGGDIKGAARFDFYSGSYSPKDSKNPYGEKSFAEIHSNELKAPIGFKITETGLITPVIVDPSMCNEKEFKVIRRGKSASYMKACNEIKPMILSGLDCGNGPNSIIDGVRAEAASSIKSDSKSSSQNTR